MDTITSTCQQFYQRNRQILLVAVAFFLLNQLIEAAFIVTSGDSHANLCKWDCEWYTLIVEQGYDQQPHAEASGPYSHHPKGDAANWAFFPALPLAGDLVATLTGLDAANALVVASKLFFLIAIFAFIKFGQAYIPTLSAPILASVVALNPYSIYANTGYTESMFLTFACLFLYLIKQQRYLLASVMGGGLTAVRLVGVFIVIPYVTACLNRLRRERKLELSQLLGVMIIPLGAALFMYFLYFQTGDALAFSHIQKAWGRAPGNPFETLYNGFSEGSLHLYWTALSILALLSQVYFLVKKEYGLALFSLVCTLIPLSTALWAMPRYIFWQPSILLFLAVVLAAKPARVVIYPVFLGGLIYMYASWLNGSWFVV